MFNGFAGQINLETFRSRKGTKGVSWSSRYNLSRKISHIRVSAVSARFRTNMVK